MGTIARLLPCVEVVNGKLDFTAAEGLGDLINAETDRQRKQALGQLGGNLREIYDDWRERSGYISLR